MGENDNNDGKKLQENDKGYMLDSLQLNKA